MATDTESRPSSFWLPGRSSSIWDSDWRERCRGWLGADAGLVLVSLAIALVGFFAGERVQVHNGLGWDGNIYASWAKDFWNQLFVHGINTYYIQRILPSAIIHYGLRLLHVPLTDANILTAFGVIDVLSITAVGWFWCLAAGELRISRAGRWLGLLFFFGNYVILKHTFYCAITMDAPAYAISMGMFWCFLTRRTLGLFALSFLGAFVWPTIIYVGAALLLFPRERQQDAEYRPAPGKLHLVLAALVAALLLVGIRYVLRKGPGYARGLIEPQYLEPIAAVLLLSLAFAWLYAFAGLGCLLNWRHLFDPAYVVRRLRLGTVVPALALLVGVKGLQYALSNHQDFMGVKDMLILTGFAAVVKPGVFLVAHVAYFGVVFLVIPFVWRPTCRLIHEQGIGLTLCILLGFLLSLNSQSRFFINVLPLLIPLVVKATDQLRWRASQYGVVAVLGLLVSKVWLTINTGPFTGQILQYPDQLMFMNSGPWMSNEMYLAHGAAVLLGSYLLWTHCFRQQSVISDQ